MSGRKPYKAGKRRQHGGRHVQLQEWFQACPAWATLKPGPRALYVELKRRYTGSNNGSLVLSHREAAEALNVHRNTVGAWFDALVERGFIRPTRLPCLGPSGVGQSAHWALEEMPAGGAEAPKGFMRWRPVDPEPIHPTVAAGELDQQRDDVAGLVKYPSVTAVGKQAGGGRDRPTPHARP